MKKGIIIGAGIGGLTTAISLLKKGNGSLFLNKFKLNYQRNIIEKMW
jgi:2-polyprenyl-6-methoxyphenol hydroxylase-like FAD-dependent oxidoreductase